jgi:hypothetical protein
MTHKTDIWERILTPAKADMPPEVARYFLSLGITAADNRRYKQLASKEQRDLDFTERAELESLVHANTVLMLLQAKARLSLRPPPAKTPPCEKFGEAK